MAHCYDALFSGGSDAPCENALTHLFIGMSRMGSRLELDGGTIKITDSSEYCIIL